MKYKLVIFDFDGTLADTFSWFVNVMDELADTYKFKRIEKSELDTLRSFDANKMIEHHEVPRWKMPMIGNHVRNSMAKDLHQISLFDGIDKLLKNLSERDIKLAVVSSNSMENVRGILGPINEALINYFECGVSVFGKPSKLKKVLRKSGVSPEETILIGDEIRDSEAARKTRIAFGAVAWGYTKIEALQAHGPIEVFSSIAEITEKLA